MTLVEVIGGLALLATLLAALLLIRARYAHQAAGADRRIRAIAAADALLTTWRQNPRTLVRAGSGPVTGSDGFAWRTQMVPNAEVNDLGAAVVRLEIYDDRLPAEIEQRPVTSVEFIIEKEEPPPRTAASLPLKGKPPAKSKSRANSAQPLKIKNAKSLHNP